MNPPFIAENIDDADGFPAGGWVTGLGLSITWPSGAWALGEIPSDVDGTTVEHVIAAAIQRIAYHNSGDGGHRPTRENSLAITKLEEALHWLGHQRSRIRRDNSPT